MEALRRHHLTQFFCKISKLELSLMELLVSYQLFYHDFLLSKTRGKKMKDRIRLNGSLSVGAVDYVQFFCQKTKMNKCEK